MDNSDLAVLLVAGLVGALSVTFFGVFRKLLGALFLAAVVVAAVRPRLLWQGLDWVVGRALLARSVPPGLEHLHPGL